MNELGPVLAWDMDRLGAFAETSSGVRAAVAGIEAALLALLVVVLLTAARRIRRPRRWLALVAGAWGLGLALVVGLVEHRRAVFITRHVLRTVALDPSQRAELLGPYLHHGSVLRLGLLAVAVLTSMAAFATVAVIFRHRSAFAPGTARLVVAAGTIVAVATVAALLDHVDQMELVLEAQSRIREVAPSDHISPEMAGPTWWPLMCAAAGGLVAVTWRPTSTRQQPTWLVVAAITLGGAAFAATRAMAADARPLPALTGRSVHDAFDPALSAKRAPQCAPAREAPTLGITGGVLHVDGHLEDGRLSTLRRKADLWRSFHPNQPFHGVLALDAPPDTPSARVATLLIQAQHHGYSHVDVPYETDAITLDTRTLGDLQYRQLCRVRIELRPSGVPLDGFRTWGEAFEQARTSGRMILAP